MTAPAAAQHTPPSRFKRLILPGLAFKAVVIGGGYATGREIAEFFLPAGPWGGLAAMALATLIWSTVCIATFLFARATGAQEYRSFFKALLGRGWIAFEVAYALFVVLILAVFGAAAGAIGTATLGTPPILGTLALMVGIAGFAAFGNAAVERLFAYVSILLYGVYALFLVFALTSFGDRIAAAFAVSPAPAGGWALGGITYAGYNIVGAVIILPVTRHLTSNRDAVVAGAIAGPLAMLPAVLFFTCMTAFMPAIAGAILPSDYMLVRLGQPAFHLLFQGMIFAALLESGTGAVHAINQRIASVWERRHGVAPGRLMRGATALALLLVCMLLAERVGLVALIASGYRLLAYVLIAIYVVPLLSYGLWRPRHLVLAHGDFA
ncbi:YkvI family membrane protein [Sphingomonas sp. PAMC 26605]|uniref:YkvI family membrane protein n=1 Tax=Sphingomonas sp. PAMC 26605 TaxID=1112214 RepID=UPI00026CA6C0|nr:membrane protein [Sphingomonas sp. PAMC 26605]